MNIARTIIRSFATLLLAGSFILIQPQRSDAARRPDPVVATLISLGNTLLPLALGAVLWTQDRGINEGYRYDMGFVFFSIGGIIGPSTGKFYADKEGDAWVSLALRGLTGTMGLAGCALWLRGEDAQTRNNGRALAGLGIGTTGLLALYDIWTSGSAALETQRERGYGPGTSQLMFRSSGENRPQIANTKLRSFSRTRLPQPRLQLPAKETRLLPSTPLVSQASFYLAPQY